MAYISRKQYIMYKAISIIVCVVLILIASLAIIIKAKNNDESLCQGYPASETESTIPFTTEEEAYEVSDVTTTVVTTESPVPELPSYDETEPYYEDYTISDADVGFFLDEEAAYEVEFYLGDAAYEEE